MKTKTYGVFLGSALGTVAVMALGSTAVSAQAISAKAAITGPTATCSGNINNSWPGTGYGQTATVIASHAITGLGIGTSLTLNAASVLAAGTYDVMAVGYDGHAGRATDNQPNEQYHLEFLDATGTVVGTTTQSTGDTIDGVDEATWAGPIGQVILSADATQIRAVHSFQGPGNVNSVQPICVGLTPLDGPPPPPTTVAAPTTTVAAPTTTVAAPTTTVAAPTTTVAAPTTTVAAPTTTVAAPTTTTTVKTEVLPAVEVAKPAAAVSGNPTFTG